VQLDSDDLLARIRQDWPTEFELSRLHLLSEVQAAEIERLTTLTQASFSGSAPRPFSLSDEPEGRHG
jgi:hypothetical protein